MDINPISAIVDCYDASDGQSLNESSVARAQSMAEETAFFLSAVKHYCVRVMPDSALLMLLQKQRRKWEKTRVAKKSPAERPFMKKQGEAAYPENLEYER
ncbi:hypothetical protein CI610_00177 [invertebrate metagenome]|uniref:Uncharacterized protein n=1 Tax=invertebrate metagenome TaxID=1711999 RepID=A0A2H9TCA0_9ZZZZ